MSNPNLVTLPFDGTVDNPRPIYAEDRRSLYRDLWSDMIIERLSFVSLPGTNDFRIASGVLLADGAYARYSGHTVNIGPNPPTANVLVAVIGREGDSSGNEQNIVFRLANRSASSATHVNGNLVVATAAGRPDGSWTLTGVDPSPIRIPDRTVTGGKLADGTITNAQIASRTITGNRLADGTVTNAQIAANTIAHDRISGGVERWHYLRVIQSGTASISTSAATITLPTRSVGRLPSAALRQGTAGVHTDGVPGRLAPFKVHVHANVNNPGNAVSTIEVGVRYRNRSGNNVDIWLGRLQIPAGANNSMNILGVPRIFDSGPGTSVVMIARRHGGSTNMNITGASMLVETWTPTS